MQAEGSKLSAGSRREGISQGLDEAPYMQGYQTALGQGRQQYRTSTSFQDVAREQKQGHKQEVYRKSASFQDVVGPVDEPKPRAPANSPPGGAGMPSDAAEPEPGSARIAAVRPAGYEEAGSQGLTTPEAAVAVGPLSRRASSLLLKGKQRKGSMNVADRLKSVRGLLDSGDESNFEDIQEELPMAAVQENDGVGNTDDAISEEPQLAQQ